jgi:hypothetical protein
MNAADASMNSTPWHARSGILRAVVASVVGMSVLGFRVLSDGSLSNDHYMHMAWAEQLRLGDLPGRDFVDPGMPLQYVLSAMVQSWWQGPFSELLLSAAMMGVAAGLTCWLVTGLTNSVLLGLAAAAIEAVLLPRLYGYPKLLMPALVLVTLWHCSARPGMLAAVTVFSGLLRYDLGAFAALSVMAGLLAAPTSMRARLRAVGGFVLATALLASPYLAAIQWREGIAEHVRESTEFSKSDAHQLLHRWDDQPAIGGWPVTDQDAAAVLYYAAGGLVVAAGLLLVVRRRSLPPATAQVLAAGTTCLACYAVWIIRHPIVARVPDAAALLSIVGVTSAVLVVRMIRVDFTHRRRVRPTLAMAGLSGILALVLVSVVELSKLDEAVERANLLRGIDKMQQRLDALVTANAEWPWDRYWPQGELPEAVRYLNQCVPADERVLLTWSAPEYYYFSRRGFGAGQALFLPPRAFTTAADQEKMIDRLTREQVPLVLINETTRGEFAAAYPEFDRYLRDRYLPSATFEIRGGATITIAVRTDLKAGRGFGEHGWPCEMSPAL